MIKAAITDGKGRVWVDQIPKPKPGAYECLCKVHACATCTGTDQKIVNGKLLYVPQYPGILGHESVGTVVEVGAKVRYVKVGDQFFHPAAAWPGEKLGEVYSAWGGFSEFALVTDSQAVNEDQPDYELNPYCRFQQKLPDVWNVSPADTTMMVTLKEAASFVMSSEIGPGLSLLILGSGPVAVSMLRFAKILGAHPVIMVARRDEPLTQARQIGADHTINVTHVDLVDAVKQQTHGKGVDMILDAAGNLPLLKTAMSVLAPNGTVAPYAIYDKGDGSKGGVYDIKQDEESIVQLGQLSRAKVNEDQAHQYLIDAVRLSLLDLSAFYSHTMPLEKISEGFDLLRSKQATKIVFEM
ncbi:MAG: zinc-binding dehydrogenase [Phycisphaeraceae bacterium]|nr:zinc-binding dehydrogenase [Phycisphaeraceae bacterium]